MGMSASQARLISLTARMNDTEYEAQQINQERLMLSNKMNEVYEQLCNMDVPTPPSKLDFAIENYSGKLNGTKTSVRRNSNGQFVAYQEATGVVTRTTAGTKGGDVKVKLGDDIPTKTVVVGEEDGNYGVVGEGQKATNYVAVPTSSADRLTGAKIKESITEWTNDEIVEDTTNNTYTLHGMVFETKAAAEQEVANHNSAIETNKAKTYVAINSNGEYAVVKLENMQDDGEYFEMITAEAFDELSEADKLLFNTGVADQNETSVNADLGTSLEGLYVVNGEGDKVTVTPLADVADQYCNIDEENGHYILKGLEVRIKKMDPNGSSYQSTEIAPNATVTSADGKKTGVVSEIATCSDKEGFAHAFEGLKHSNPDVSDADLESRFLAVSYNDGSFAFVLRSDYQDGDGEVYIYELEENGKYEEEMEKDKYKITYSPSGSIQGIETTDGSTAILSSEQKFNEWDYEEANAQYKYEKAVYDQEQNRLNKQTSIYQRQDKQLELKLTRLDNERNALNTEIEAVKKVIQDAIDRGFKTFSG